MIHPLLKRQLEKYWHTADIPREYAELLNIISRTYREFDEDRIMTERSFDITSQELVEINKKLESQIHELDQKTKLLHNALQDIEHFKRAVESSSDPIAITDSAANILYVNPRWEAITGYNQHEVMHQSITVLHAENIDQDEEQNWQKAIVDKKEFQSNKLLFTTKHNKTYDVHVTVYPIFDTANEVQFFVHIHHDISDQKRIENAKNDFVSIASHQLRSPVSIVRWSLELLQEKNQNFSHSQNRLVENASEAVLRIVSTINVLLTVSRIESRTIIQNSILTDMKLLLQHCFTQCEAESKAKNVTITHSGCTQAEIFTDPSLVQEVLINLINNAIKYSKPSSTIDIHTEHNGNGCVIQIADSGIGIPAHEQPKIFTKLYRAHNAIHTDTSGSGLGLYIAKSLIEILGGTLSFTSTENVGTTFTIFIPNATHEAVTNS